MSLQSLIDEKRFEEAFQHINDLFMELNNAFTIPDRSRAEAVVQSVLHNIDIPTVTHFLEQHRQAGLADQSTFSKTEALTQEMYTRLMEFSNKKPSHDTSLDQNRN